MKWTFVCIVILLTACTKELDFKLADSQPLYVIEGRISDLQGPYYIRITRSTNLLGNQLDVTQTLDNADPVQGAAVIIKDDMGTVDTLIPAADHTQRMMYYYHNHKFDSFDLINPSLYFTSERGYYQTTKLRGLPGHTYQLFVRIGDSTFQASAYMPRVTDLDSAAVKIDTVVDASGNKGNLPLAWFKEPQEEKNYYMLQFNNHTMEYPYDQMLMSYYYYSQLLFVVDDKILPPYVNGLSVQIIVPDSYPWSDAPQYSFVFNSNNGAQIRLCSLTKESYEYFSVLRKQWQADGNVYKPTPASAKGNIQGGALGLFWASSISYKLIMP